MTGTSRGTDSERLAGFLRAIPGPADNSAPLADLCARGGLDPASASAALVLTRALGGPIVAVRGTPGNESVQASTTVGWYFLKSMAEYVAGDAPIFDNWERLTVSRKSERTLSLPSGPQLFYLMENRRMERHRNPACLREIQVAQINIKARSRRAGGDLYLVQYDDRSDDFQLTGGRRRTSDADLRLSTI